MRNGLSLQVFAQALINVCYRLQAELDWNREPNGEPAESPDGQCAPHAYVDAFHRRLERGRWFYTPCLGWKEFVPDYPRTVPRRHRPVHDREPRHPGVPGNGSANPTYLKKLTER